MNSYIKLILKKISIFQILYSRNWLRVYKVQVTSYLNLIRELFFHKIYCLCISQPPPPAFKGLSRFVTLSFEKWMLLDMIVVSFLTVLPPSYTHFMSPMFSLIVVCPYFYSSLCFFLPQFFFLLFNLLSLFW